MKLPPKLTSFVSTSTLVEEDWDYSWDGIEFDRSDWDIQRSFLHQKSIIDQQVCPLENCLACKLNPRGFPDSKYYLVYTPSGLTMLLSSVPGMSYADQARDWLHKMTGLPALKHSLIVPKTGSKNVFNLKPVSGMLMDGIPVYMKENTSLIKCLKDDLDKFAQNKPILGGSIDMMTNYEIFNSENYEEHDEILTNTTTEIENRPISFLSGLMKTGSNIINYVNEKVESLTSNEAKDRQNVINKGRDSIATLTLLGIDVTAKVAERLPIAGNLFKKARQALFKTAKFKGAKLDKMKNFCFAPGNKNELSFSFSGKSLNPSYEIGAAKCFKDYINPTVLNASTFVGSSTGAVIATAMALDLDLDTLQKALCEISMASNRRIFGSFSVRSRLIREFLNDYIPEDFSLLPNQLCILVTSLPSMKAYMKKRFMSKEELIDTLMASLYIPLMYETPITDSKRMYFSGNFSDDLPILDDMTITVSSTSNCANVSPTDDGSSLLDYVGLNWTQETYSSHSMSGFIDALKYLQLLQKEPITLLFFNKNPMDGQ
jgi:hypothetical protein